MRFSLVFLSFLFYFWANISAAIEEPSYKVISANEIYEVREYEDRIAVQNNYKIMGKNGAFRKLFKYISGSNTFYKKIEYHRFDSYRIFLLKLNLSYSISYYLMNFLNCYTQSHHRNLKKHELDES